MLAKGHETSNVGGTMDSNGNILTTYDSFSYSYFQGSAATALLQTVTLLDSVNWQTGTLYTRNYSYDNQNRLTVVDVLNSSKTEVQKWTYGYDANGNRTSYTQLYSPVSISYTYTGGNEMRLATWMLRATTSSACATTIPRWDGGRNRTRWQAVCSI